ncbi:hypothetical protein WMY93_015947 [Mugilogobius chulae]|uniref:Uncharacterized protein n=1 Tax=Mugilogobius chulae TaxID=88201 RepID=A0AAW0P2R9_9GOBI
MHRRKHSTPHKTEERSKQINYKQQEQPGAMQETQFKAAEVQKRVIYFTSGETLDLDSEEEEDEEEKPTLFRDNERKGRFSFKNLAFRVGRLSLLTCDFLGERLAGFLGLSDAKYQYAVDQHHRQKKMFDGEATDAGTTPLSLQGTQGVFMEPLKTLDKSKCSEKRLIWTRDVSTVDTSRGR